MLVYSKSCDGSILPEERNSFSLVWYFPLQLQPHLLCFSFWHLFLQKDSIYSYLPGHGLHFLTSSFRSRLPAHNILLVTITWPNPTLLLKLGSSLAPAFPSPPLTATQPILLASFGGSTSKITVNWRLVSLHGPQPCPAPSSPLMDNSASSLISLLWTWPTQQPDFFL